MIDIRKFADLEQLQKIQDSFSASTGLAAIALAADGKYITKGSGFTDFCMKYTRGCAEGERRCVQCDKEGKGCYYCHAGLMDFATDIIVDGEKVGAIIGGQVLPEPPDEQKFRRIARDLGVDEEGYVRAVKKVAVRDEKTIRSAADLLGFIFNTVVNLQYVKHVDRARMSTFNEELSGITANISSAKSLMSDLHNTATMEHILSLNASIESAKAGKAGVGFAVVAREIGELSKQSGQVYDEIERLVGEVQAAVDKIENLG